MMHAASAEKSERLKRILAFLRACGDMGATSWELVQHGRTVAPGTCVSELRAAGYVIVCEPERRNGKRIYRYTLKQST